MTTDSMILIFCWAMAIIGVLSIIYFIFATCLCCSIKKRVSQKNIINGWYEAKFHQLLGAFSTGLVFITIVLGFLALLPRYDLDNLQKEIQKLNLETKEAKSIVEKSFNDKIRPLLEKAIAQEIVKAKNELNKNNKKIFDDLIEVFKKNQQSMNHVKEELKKNKTVEEQNKIDSMIPRVEIPQVEIPRVEIPRVEIPRVEIPTTR